MVGVVGEDFIGFNIHMSGGRAGVVTEGADVTQWPDVASATRVGRCNHVADKCVTISLGMVSSIGDWVMRKLALASVTLAEAVSRGSVVEAVNELQTGVFAIVAMVLDRRGR